MFKKPTLSIAALALAGSLGMTAAPAVAEDIVFMTGPAGGSWYPLGGAIKNILEAEVPGMSVTIRPGAGLINLKGVSGGKAHMGFSLVMSAVDGLSGKPPFEEKLSDICNLGSLYNNFLQVPTTDFSFNSAADLKGKKLVTLPRGNTTEVGARALLQAAGLSYDDMEKVNFSSISDGVNMLKDGQADVMMTITSVPNGSLLDLTNSRKIKFLSITDEQFAAMKKENAGWGRLTIPANTYPNQTEPVNIAGFPAHLILNCSTVSEESAYNITKALIKRGQELGAIVKSLSTMTAKDMVTDIGVPLHPGSAKAYKEAGAL
ncbi:MAG: TAXI family TRAP transporter solute-binding subunit [Proteobacteria bacterium]|nr:TAXI family TRAP transporter solute-binding subunit [Pseudomonadota bacterium]